MSNMNGNMKDIWKQQLENCTRFFNAVAELLKDTHVVVASRSKKWPSACLVEKGQENQVTYYGKPVNSLRVGPNWNWRAGLDRCSNPDYIQCVTPDLPYVKQRPKDHPEWASPPVWGNMVAYFSTDNKYHCVFGEKYDKEEKQWIWVEAIPEKVAEMILENGEKLHSGMKQEITK